MSKKNIIVIILSVVLITACFLLFAYINSNKLVYQGKINELEDRNLEMKKEIEKISLNADKYKGLIGIYDMNIKTLHEHFKDPEFLGDDKETLNEVYQLIKEDKIFKDKLIFTLGPIKKESNEVFLVEIHAFEQINQKELEKNIDEFIPTDLYALYMAKITKIDGKLQYEVYK